MTCSDGPAWYLPASVGQSAPHTMHPMADPTTPKQPRKLGWRHLAAIAAVVALTLFGINEYQDWRQQREIDRQVDRIIELCETDGTC